jgi:glycolate oxidase iron-sulfur subunit
MPSSAAAANDLTDRIGAGARSRILALADQCVMCGLCQPQCPTYRVARTEAESPRGRIALAKAIALGTLDAAARVSAVTHLDQCLTCMNCQRVCPSQVHYGELIVATRQMLAPSRRVTWGDRLLRALTARPRWFGAALRLGNMPGLRRVSRSAWLERALRPLGLDRFMREMPHLPPAARAVPRRTQAKSVRGRVGLFLGCAAAALDRDVHAAAIRLLNALGYEAVLPRGQGCCGALALHSGEVERADALGASTRSAFVDAGVDTVLVSASGCFGTLHDRVFTDAGIAVREIHEFLAADAHIGDLAFQPLARHAALHTPCTQANVARAGGAVRALLGRIPQLQISALPDEPRCCGAAGDYFLNHAAIADTLRAQTLEHVAAMAPDMLVTSNVGCRTFLDNGLHRGGSSIPVMHPVALLAQQLEN